MNEKVERVFGSVNRVSSGVANVFCESALLLVKATGKSIGYAERAAGSVYNGTRRFIGFGSRKTAGLFTGGLRKKFGLNKAEVQARIAMLDNRIREMYLQIGKIGSDSDDIDGLLATVEVQDIIEQIKKLEDESSALTKYLNELEASEQQGVSVRKLSVKPRSGFEGRTLKRMIAAIEHGIKKATFALRSDAIIFEKALQDLLDYEMDIKRLAVSELGRLGNKHAAPAMKEALSINNPELQAEIINALIQIEDKDVFAVCKRFVAHDYAGIRTACIRGLYKAGQSESVPLLIEALKDENIEVRNSSAMFLGWLEANKAVPALLQAAADEDLRVRKSAILSIANIRDAGSVLPLIRLLSDDSGEIRDKIIAALERITGESIEFNIGADVQERLKSIERLKEWWIKKKYEITDEYEAAAQKPANQAERAQKAAAEHEAKAGKQAQEKVGTESAEPE